MTVLIYHFLGWLSDLMDAYFPVFSFPEQYFLSFVRGVVYLFEMIARLNFMIPFDTVIAPIVILATIKAGLITFYIFNWVWTKIMDLIPG